MPSKKLTQLLADTQTKYPSLSLENIGRILLLTKGLNVDGKDSYPDPFTHAETIYTAPTISTDPVLSFLDPTSPFSLIATGDRHVLLYEHEFVDQIIDYEERWFDFRTSESPFFYVTELNGDVVLKLNPIQLCRFFRNPVQKPCSFCFRNDMVQRFKNYSAEKLVADILETETKRDNLATLRSIDEISIVTGTYKNEAEYVSEMVTLVKGLKPHVKSSCRVVVGSHEAKTAETFEIFKAAGVTRIAFPVESLDDNIRVKAMANDKGAIPIAAVIADISAAIKVFGPDEVIVRLVVGMGDILDESLRARIYQIVALGGTTSPLWNINIYMPFTHYHWRLFHTKPPFQLDYLYAYCAILNEYVPSDRQVRFKVSP